MSEWWFNAVSATEVIFTARTCYNAPRQSQALHKSLYSAAAFKKSQITSGLTVLKKVLKEGTW